MAWLSRRNLGLKLAEHGICFATSALGLNPRGQRRGETPIPTGPGTLLDFPGLPVVLPTPSTGPADLGNLAEKRPSEPW